MALGLDGHFLHRAVVVVEPRGAGALGVDDALDHRAMLVGLGVVSRVTGLRAGGAARDVDAVDDDGRRGGEHRPEVARIRERGEPFLAEVGGRGRGRDVNDRRLARHRHSLLQGGDAHFGIDRGGKAKADAHAFAHDGAEPGQFIGDLILAGWHGGESIFPSFARDVAASALHAGTCDGDRHARKDATGGVGHFPVDGSSSGTDLCRGRREKAGRQQDHYKRDDSFHCPSGERVASQSSRRPPKRRIARVAHSRAEGPMLQGQMPGWVDWRSWGRMTRRHPRRWIGEALILSLQRRKIRPPTPGAEAIRRRRRTFPFVHRL